VPSTRFALSPAQDPLVADLGVHGGVRVQVDLLAGVVVALACP
jgi:hypothetical protein